MGQSHSQSSQVLTDGGWEDPFNSPACIPPLPPHPAEVKAHCSAFQCKLSLHSLELPSKRGKGGRTVSGTREYVVHRPSMSEAGQKKIPLLICLHGTDETVFDTELLVQEDESTSWLDLSHKENFFLVFPQSLRYSAKDDVPISWRPPGDSLRSCWQPDHNDELFLSLLLDQLLLNYPIDQSRVYCIGYSNGGLFLTSLLLSHGFDKRFAAICNYMGGMSPEQMTEEAGLVVEDAAKWVEKPCTSLLGISRRGNFPNSAEMKRDANSTADTPSNNCKPLVNIFNNPLKWPPPATDTVCVVHPSAPPPVYIVTGSKDSNRNYCYNALCGFQQMNYPVFFDDFHQIGHEYQSESTRDIWMFLKCHKRCLLEK